MTNPVQRLKNTGTDLELWWDSSPLVYQDWLATQAEHTREIGLFRLNGGSTTPQFTPRSLLQGATTNQPLTWNVIANNPGKWSQWLEKDLRHLDNPSAEEVMWRLFIKVAQEGAQMLDPIHDASDGRLGYICCQVDPRDMTDLDAMLAQARRIHAAHPNIMVKMPGTQEGIEGVRILTAEGIPTNVTLGFTVAQLVAVGEAAQAGLAEAEARGTDLSHWRSCAVMMLGRYEDAPPMQAQAAELDLRLSDADKRWAGIAIFRKAYRLFQERGYPSKLMAASMRLGPVIDGVTRVWHLEKLAGANSVLTVFPNIFEQLIQSYQTLPLESQIDESIPDEVLERLLRIPYFLQAYEENGIAPEDWVHHPALQATGSSFAQAMEKVEQFAAGMIG